jgi:serine/threonine protein phosphatase PrpC
MHELSPTLPSIRTTSRGKMAHYSGIWEHTLEHAALTDIGLRRTNNQDALAVVIADSQETWQQRGHLFMVADGMGAHAAGELASKLATDTVALTYSKLLELSPADALLRAMQEANRQIHGRGEADPEFRGMGTTSTVLLLLPQGALLSHVGDSRAYRLRGNRFEQLTFDHSLIWEMRATGQFADDDIHDYIPKNIITRSLGPGSDVQIDLEGPFPIAAGDTFLVCSDGLCGPVEDEEIGAILSAMPPGEAVHALVDLANLRGGPDNITAIVVRVAGPPLSAAEGPGLDSSGRTRRPRAIHPLVWPLLGVSSLGAAGAAAMEHWAIALGCLAGTILAGVIALVQQYGGRDVEPKFDRQPLGKGPYRSSRCAADGEFVDRLSRLVEELRDAASRESWVLDWSRFNALLDQAATAKQAADHVQAVRQYFRAVNFMMVQLKLQRACGDGGSVFGP